MNTFSSRFKKFLAVIVSALLVASNLFIAVAPYQPVRADTYSFTIQVAAATDDCDRSYTNSSWNVGAFYAGYGSATAQDIGSAARFLARIPIGSTITSAYLTITGTETDSYDTVNTRLRVEKSVNSLTFSTSADFDARTWTTASAGWVAMEHWAANVEYTSPDITSCIQEAVNQSEWTDNSPITVLWDDFEKNTTHTHDFTYRNGWDYSSSPSKVPKLYVEYTLPTWWSSSWLYREKFTFDNSASTDNLTNFPVLITVNSTRINYAHTQDAGQDIRFVEPASGVSLSYEIEKWDETGNSYIWVNVPQVDAGSNTDYIWMYYGNPAASDAQNVNGTWNSNYTMVQHLKDTTTSTVSDSTVNAYTGTKTAANQPIEATGKIYKGQSFDGSNDLIATAATLDVTSSGYTIEAWINTSDNTIAYQDIVSKALSASDLDGDYQFRLDNDDLSFYYRKTAAYKLASYANVISNNAWYHCAITVSTTGLMTVYVNGVAGSVTDTTGLATNAHVVRIGMVSGTAGPFKGLIDEVRISNAARSISWIRASYLNEVDTFVTYGSEESLIVIPTVTTSAIADIGVTFATLGGNITDTGGENCTQQIFQWGTASGNYTSNWTETGTYSIGVFSHIESNLTADTTYYYRAGTNNTAGIGYGNEVSFSTYTGIPDIVTKPATNFSHGVGVLNGEVINLNGATYALVHFNYGLDSYDYSTPTQNITAIGPIQVAIILPQAGLWHFQMVADVPGTTVSGLDSSFETPSMANVFLGLSVVIAVIPTLLLITLVIIVTQGIWKARTQGGNIRILKLVAISILTAVVGFALFYFLLVNLYNLLVM